MTTRQGRRARHSRHKARTAERNIWIQWHIQVGIIKHEAMLKPMFTVTPKDPADAGRAAAIMALLHRQLHEHYDQIIKAMAARHPFIYELFPS